MESFYKNLAVEDAAEIERIARLMYDVRTARDEVLCRLGAADEAQALQCIVSGELSEHPNYEYYLSARILTDLHGQVRAELATRTQEVQEK